jgi:acyl-CoA dehydrogenase
MPDRSFLSWPFFEDHHRLLADQLDEWCTKNLPVAHDDVDTACRELVAKLGSDGWLKPTAVDRDNPGPLDVRTLCITRETLARHDGLADFAFAMQGLGTGALSLFGTRDQQDWLARTRAGKAISAFALSEPRSGSDVATWRWQPSVTATVMFSMAKRPGFPMVASPTSMSSSPAPTRRRAPRVFQRSSCRPRQKA